MGFWQDVGDSISHVGKEAVAAGKDVAESVNLRSQMNSLESENEELYNQLGKKYFQDYKGKYRESMKSITSRITANLNQIDDLQTQLDSKKDDADAHGGKIKDAAKKTGAAVKEQTKQGAQKAQAALEKGADKAKDVAAQAKVDTKAGAKKVRAKAEKAKEDAVIDAQRKRSQKQTSK